MNAAKLNPDVYLRAAELVDDNAHRFACLAIARAEREATGSTEPGPHVDAFTALYYTADVIEEQSKTDGGRCARDLFGKTSAFFSQFGMPGADERSREHRVFALLLAAEIAADQEVDA